MKRTLLAACAIMFLLLNDSVSSIRPGSLSSDVRAYRQAHESEIIAEIIDLEDVARRHS